MPSEDEKRRLDAMLSLLGNPKMMRETLCVAQTRIGNSWIDADRRPEHVERLQRLIDACDQLRPAGPDGKHGDLHTEWCCCDAI